MTILEILGKSRAREQETRELRESVLCDPDGQERVSNRLQYCRVVKKNDDSTELLPEQTQHVSCAARLLAVQNAVFAWKVGASY